jgi:rod shape-determining protein MreD
MIKKVIWASVFAIIAAILQSTLFAKLAIYHAVPDLALGILIFSAYNNGAMTGQLTGFISGLLLDFFSAAPLGLNTFVRTLIGAAAGSLKGAFFLDAVFLPLGLCASATLLKALMFAGLHLLFGAPVPCYNPTEPVLWVELVMNTVTAPFLFALLKLFKNILIEERVDA